MSINKRKIVAVAAAAAGFMLINPVGADDGNGAVKLQGAWVAKAVGVPLRWSYVLSADPSGRRAGLHGSIEVGFGGGFDIDEFSPLLGEVVMTGPDTAKFNSVWYGLKKTPPGSPISAQVVFIGMNSGDVKFDDAGHATASHNIAYYPPSSDGDGDGLPDPGATPVVAQSVTTHDTRLPVPK